MYHFHVSTSKLASHPFQVPYIPAIIEFLTHAEYPLFCLHDLAIIFCFTRNGSTSLFLSPGPQRKPTSQFFKWKRIKIFIINSKYLGPKKDYLTIDKRVPRSCLQSLMIDKPHFVYSTYNRMVLSWSPVFLGDTSPQNDSDNIVFFKAILSRQ